MASTPKQIVPAQAAPSATTTLYTSSIVITRIDKLTVTNISAAAATITIYMVPSGGTAGATNTTTSAQAILPGKTWNSPNEYGLYLNAGDFLAVVASAANALTIAVGGTEVTP